MAHHGSVTLALTLFLGVDTTSLSAASAQAGQASPSAQRSVPDAPDSRSGNLRRVANPLRAGRERQRFSHLHADVRDANLTTASRLVVGSDYAGPVDPSDPSRPAICNPVIRRAIDSVWGRSMLAAHRAPISVNDKVEFGFAIQEHTSTQKLVVEAIETSDLTGSKPNELAIPVDAETIATVHTHNVGARPTPSAADVASELPAFVKSQFYLYVTIPGTGTYAEIEMSRVCPAWQ